MIRDDNYYPFFPILTMLVDKYGDSDPRLHFHRHTLDFTYDIVPFEGWNDHEHIPYLNNDRKYNLKINGFDCSDTMLIFGQFALRWCQSTCYQFIGLFNSKTKKIEDILYDNDLFRLESNDHHRYGLYFTLDLRLDSVRSPSILYKHWLLLAGRNIIQIYRINFATYKRDYKYNYHIGNMNSDPKSILKKNILQAPSFVTQIEIFKFTEDINRLYVIDNEYNYNNAILKKRAFSREMDVRNINFTNSDIRTDNSKQNLYQEPVRILVFGIYSGWRLIDRFRVKDIYFPIDFNLNYTVSHNMTNISVEILRDCLDDAGINIKIDGDESTRDGVSAADLAVSTNLLSPTYNTTQLDKTATLFGTDLDKNKQFLQCFDDAHAYLHMGFSIELINKRYLLITGMEIEKMILRVSTSGGDTSWSEKVYPETTIVYDFFINQWMFRNDLSQNLLGHIERCRPINAMQIGKSVYAFAWHNRKYRKNFSLFKCKECRDSDFCCNRGHQFSCWKLDLESFLSWDIERMIWIGYYKNIDNDKCLITKLPKDVIVYLLEFIKCRIFESKTSFRKLFSFEMAMFFSEQLGLNFSIISIIQRNNFPFNLLA